MDGGAGSHGFKSYDLKQGQTFILETAESVKKEAKERASEISYVKKISGKLKKSDFGSLLEHESLSKSEEYKINLHREYKLSRLRAKQDALKFGLRYIPKTDKSIDSYEKFSNIVMNKISHSLICEMHAICYDLIKYLKISGDISEECISYIENLLQTKVTMDDAQTMMDLAKNMDDFIGELDYQGDLDDDGAFAVPIVENDFESSSEDVDDSTSSNDEGGEIDILDEDNVVKINNFQAYSPEMLSAFLNSKYPNEDEMKNKYDEIMQLLKGSDDNFILEMELIRVLGVEAQSAIKAIINGKELILAPTEKQKQRSVTMINLKKFDTKFESIYSDNYKSLKPTYNEEGKYNLYKILPEQSQGTLKSRIISIAELPELLQLPFKNSQFEINVLNRVQSAVFDGAFNHNDNILLSAPTGSGKTIVALLCILHLYKENIDTDDKVVYVAPMKSLVQEMVESFSMYLKPFHKKVQELTGDSSASVSQLEQTDVIVSTPEKWDIITRKVGSRTLTEKIRLTIIDEIHLLNNERGPVLESIIIRSKSMNTRIVGLSATMPNYRDIANFLNVTISDDNTNRAYNFNDSDRPIPLEKNFCGFVSKSFAEMKKDMNIECYRIAREKVGNEGTSLLIFIHSRKESEETARILSNIASKDVNIKDDYFSRFGTNISSDIANIHNKELKELLPTGFAFHHAGLDSNDRHIVEDLFRHGKIKVLCTTATLAWGVNLPAETVIIKGTHVYNPSQGKWENLSYLDVLQMFGRAGRPNYSKKGEAYLMTQDKEIGFYLRHVTDSMNIESYFLRSLVTNLNAEIALKTVFDENSAIQWISKSFLNIRIYKSPTVYGLKDNDDSTIQRFYSSVISSAINTLIESRLVQVDGEYYESTDLGRIASNYYVTEETILTFHKNIKPFMSDIDLLRLFCLANEFKNISVRPEEVGEIAKLLMAVPIPIKEGRKEPIAKVNALLQCYICKRSLNGFSIRSDLAYISQSGERLFRCLFELALSRGYVSTALSLLAFAQMVSRRMFATQSPLRQILPLIDDPNPLHLMHRVESKSIRMESVEKYYKFLPKVIIENEVATRIMNNLLSIHLKLRVVCTYSSMVHSPSEGFWVFVYDSDMERLLYYELLILPMHDEEIAHDFDVSIYVPIEPVIRTDEIGMKVKFCFVHVIADRWIGCQCKKYVNYSLETVSDRFVPLSNIVDDQSLLIISNNSIKRNNAMIDIIKANSDKKLAVLVPNYYVQNLVASLLNNFSVLSGDKVEDSQKVKIGNFIFVAENFFLNPNIVQDSIVNFHIDRLFIFDIHCICDTRFSDMEIVISLFKFIFKHNPEFNIVASSCALYNVTRMYNFISVYNNNQQMPNVKVLDSVNYQIIFRSFEYPSVKARFYAMLHECYNSIMTKGSTIIFVPNFITHLLVIEEITRLDADIELLSYYDGLGDDERVSLLNKLACNSENTMSLIAPITSVWDINRKYSKDTRIINGSDKLSKVNVIVLGTEDDYVSEVIPEDVPILDVLEALDLSLGSQFYIYTYTAKKEKYKSYLEYQLPIENHFYDERRDSEPYVWRTVNQLCCSSICKNIDDLYEWNSYSTYSPYTTRDSFLEGLDIYVRYILNIELDEDVSEDTLISSIKQDSYVFNSTINGISLEQTRFVCECIESRESSLEFIIAKSPEFCSVQVYHENGSNTNETYHDEYIQENIDIIRSVNNKDSPYHKTYELQANHVNSIVSRTVSLIKRLK